MNICYTIGKNRYSRTALPVETTTLEDLKITVNPRDCVSGMITDISLTPCVPITMESLSIEGAFAAGRYLSVFCNGFQSWTESREFTVEERAPPLFPAARLLSLDRYGDYHFVSYSGKRGSFHSHTYTYLKTPENSITLSGSLDEGSGYTIFRIELEQGRISVDKDCRGKVLHRVCRLLSLVQLEGKENEVFNHYWNLMGCLNADTVQSERRMEKHTYTGWTSWYKYYTEISEKRILKNLNTLKAKNIPLDIFQIDDGYEKAVGDWLEIKPAFPQGMGFLAGKIKEYGYIPGIWLAPFVCERKSRIYREHPDWLMRDKRGRAVPAGWNPLWSGRFYALDLDNPGFTEYLREVFRTVFIDWGYDMVKLDFLYAAGLVSAYGKSRGERMKEALRFLAECAKGRRVLGCGVPIGSALGVFNACRIGSDMALRWEDRLLKAIRYRERVSTINALHSVIGRHHTGGRAFLNDPDVFILRSGNNSLTPQQRHTLFLATNIFGQFLFTSDSVSEYGRAEERLFRLLFPFREKAIEEIRHTGDCYSIYFSIEENHYLALLNLERKVRSVAIPEGDYFEYDSFREYALDHGAEEFFFSGGINITLPSFASRCFLRVPSSPYRPAGTTTHIFPGSEIEEIISSGREIKIKRYSHSTLRGKAWIVVPSSGKYRVNGEEIEAIRLPPGKWIVRASF